MLRTEENWAPDRYRIDCILDIVWEASLRKLREGDEGAQREKIALLIDGNNSGAQPTFREFLGGLTAQELYEELRKQVGGLFRTRIPNLIECSSETLIAI